MIGFLSSRKRIEQFIPQVPSGNRIYCIGDVHGRDDLLAVMHQAVMDDAANYNGRKVAIYLGDYIDRGVNSKGVVERLINKPLKGIEQIFLRGNHEQTLLSFLQLPQAGHDWLSFGGQATLYSYGVKMQGIPLKKAHFLDVQQQLKDLIPENHRIFFENLQLMHIEGDYCFVHAGIRPGTALNRQREEDLLWIRDEFTASKRQHEKVIVHGHTVTKEPELLPNRIGIDTGAYCGGNLTCLVLEGSERRFIVARPKY